jgi:hypothetical protein
MATSEFFTDVDGVDLQTLETTRSYTAIATAEVTCLIVAGHVLLNDLVKRLVENSTIISDVWRQQIEKFCNPAANESVVTTTSTSSSATPRNSAMNEAQILGIAFGASVGVIFIVISVVVTLIFIKRQL